LSEISARSQTAAPDDFEDLFRHAPCAYLTLVPDGRIARANRTLEEWLAVEPGALDGMLLRDLLTVPGRIFYETNIAPALRLQRELEEIVLDLIDRDGAKLPVLVSARPRTSGDRLIETRMIMVRARERRGYERDLQGREAAAVRLLNDERSSSELREQFIAVLGHDLRNPLASIVGATRLLRREVTGEKSLRVLQMMETSVDRMAGLIDDVMDFARGRLGSGIVVKREIVPLEPVLRHVVAELEVNQPSRVFVCDFALNEPVSHDEGRISQLVSNLLGNALAHGDPRSPVRLSASTDNHMLTLSVSNAGSPIPPAAMERLFQPFFRGEVRDSRQGLGLGLHIASEIARAHDGALSVRSDEHETRFTLVMPCVPPD
jgi:sigma-B regulation protein RsbU (phosphoserine phosphatase)